MNRVAAISAIEAGSRRAKSRDEKDPKDKKEVCPQGKGLSLSLRSFVSFMSFALAGMPAAGANVYDDTFYRANAAYEQGDFEASIQMYERLVGEGVADPAVFFNLGNACYRTDHIARAIANYERALALAPRFQSARDNLELAVRRTPRRLERPLPPEWKRSLFFWHYASSPGAARAAALTSWLLFWAALALRQWRFRRWLGPIATVLLPIAAALAGSAWGKAHPPILAVVDAQTLCAHFETDENSPVRFELSLGDRIEIERLESDWARIVTPDNNRGWVRADDLVTVGPPYPSTDGAKP